MATASKKESSNFDMYANHEVRITILESNFSNISHALSRIETKVDKICDKQEENFKVLDAKGSEVFFKLDKKIDNRFFWLLGTILTFMTTVIGLFVNLYRH